MVETLHIADTIRRFVGEAFMIDFDKDAGPETDLFEAHFLDSFGFVELVTFLEQTFAIKLSEDDLAEPAMGTLAGMQSLVTKHLAARGVTS